MEAPISSNSATVPLIVLVGPTAVGKTDLSLKLAHRFNAEIVSADSRLFYRGMDIGTAKPHLDDRALVPHHLIDISDPDDTWSLARFQHAASTVIAEIFGRGKVPLLVGGTGQYIHAITKGWTPPPVAPDDRIRSELEHLVEVFGYERLFDRLQQLDPKAAKAIDPRNYRRVIRALEVIQLTGKKFSEQRGTSECPYRLLNIGLYRNRPQLYSLVDARIESMFTQGILNEVGALLAKGYSPTLPAMTSIGYRDCVEVLQNRISVDEAKVRMRRATRVYIRRQANWFKMDDPAIHWFDVGDSPMVRIDSLIQSFLNVPEDYAILPQHRDKDPEWVSK